MAQVQSSCYPPLQDTVESSEQFEVVFICQARFWQPARFMRPKQQRQHLHQADNEMVPFIFDKMRAACERPHKDSIRKAEYKRQSTKQYALLACLVKLLKACRIDAARKAGRTFTQDKH